MGTVTPTKPIKNLLCDFVNEGGFEYTFIVDESGLLMACTESDMPAIEAQAALLARLKNTIGMVDLHKGLGSIEEMVFNVSGRKKLVCRNFEINQNNLILAISMESYRRYRRLTTSLVRQLQNTWDI